MKINIGCGEKILSGYINVDKYPINPSVIPGDLETRLPFEDSFADEVLLDNVIEHISSINNAMSEIYRVLRPGGIVKIRTPHYSSQASWRDPTHIHHLSYFSFDYFVKPRNYIRQPRFSIESKNLTFGGGISLFGRLFFVISPNFYEKKLCFIFPASTIEVSLRKI